MSLVQQQISLVYSLSLTSERLNYRRNWIRPSCRTCISLLSAHACSDRISCYQQNSNRWHILTLCIKNGLRNFAFKNTRRLSLAKSRSRFRLQVLWSCGCWPTCTWTDALTQFMADCHWLRTLARGRRRAACKPRARTVGTRESKNLR